MMNGKPMSKRLFPVLLLVLTFQFFYAARVQR